jgi:hypothetical protein
VKADQKARGRNLGGKVPFGYPADLADFIRPITEARSTIKRSIHQESDLPRPDLLAD